MSSIRLETLRTRLASYLAAETRILESQEYVIGNGGAARRNRRAELEQVRLGIKECESEITRLEAAANPRTRRIIRLRPR